MANKVEQEVFSIGDRVVYIGHDTKRVGTISNIQSLYGGGIHRYQIIFDGSSESDRLWYEQKDLSKADDSRADKDSCVEILFCRKCGTRLNQNAVFCRKCGSKVEVPERKNNHIKASDSPSKDSSVNEEALKKVAEEIARLRRYEVFLNDVRGKMSIDDLICDTLARVYSDREGIEYDEAKELAATKYKKMQKNINYEDPIILSLRSIYTGEKVTIPSNEAEGKAAVNDLFKNIQTFDDFMKKYGK